MDKRLEKRHKRQVARAREKVRISEPDVRTPEQIKAAREASRAAIELRTDPHSMYTTPSHASSESSEEEKAEKTDGSTT